jgi:hypothetical protein
MRELFFTILVLLLVLLFFFFLYQVYRFYNPYFPDDDSRDNCMWTRWGCCSDKITPRYDQEGTNCRGLYFKSPHNPCKGRCDLK